MFISSVTRRGKLESRAVSERVVGEKKKNQTKLIKDFTPFVVQCPIRFYLIFSFSKPFENIFSTAVFHTSHTMNKFAAFAVVLLAAKFTCGSPAHKSGEQNNNDVSQFVIHEDEFVQKLNTKCAVKDVSSCVMLKMVTYMNRLMKKNNLEIGDMVEIAKKDGASAEETITAETVSIESSARGGYSDETAFGEMMADKMWKYVKSRSLKIKVLPEADFVVSTSPEHDGSLNFGMSFRSGKDLESGEH